MMIDFLMDLTDIYLSLEVLTIVITLSLFRHHYITTQKSSKTTAAATEYEEPTPNEQPPVQQSTGVTTLHPEPAFLPNLSLTRKMVGMDATDKFILDCRMHADKHITPPQDQHFDDCERPKSLELKRCEHRTFSNSAEVDEIERKVSAASSTGSDESESKGRLDSVMSKLRLGRNRSESGRK